MRRETRRKRSATIAVLDTRIRAIGKRPIHAKNRSTTQRNVRISQHYSSEKKCKIALKEATEDRGWRKISGPLPLWLVAANNIAK